MARFVSAGVLFLSIIFTLGCGASGSGSTTQQLRVVMASADAPAADILINGSEVATSLLYRNATGYIPVTTHPQRLQVVEVSNSSSLLQQTITVPSGADQTLLVTGPVSHLQGVVLTDGAKTQGTSAGQVRIVNASPTMGPADVYITSGGGFSGSTPVAKNLAFGQSTGYQVEAIGNYNVFLTAPGTSNVLLNTGVLALTQSQLQTVVALDAVGGGFTYIVLTDQ